MASRIKTALRRCVLVLALLGCSVASGSEADQAAPFKRILSRHVFRPWPAASPFCRAFLRDLRSQKGVRFIEPVLEASTYEDPVLQPYKSRCGEQPLNERFLCEARGAPEWDSSKDRKEQREELLALCESTHMTSNFKLFELDINDDASDGRELVVYGEKSLGPMNRDRKKYYSNGAYNIFNSKTCDLIGSIPSSDPFDYFVNERLDSHNAIVTYGGRHFIVDLYELPGYGRNPLKPLYGLEVWGSGPSNRKLQCGYSSGRKTAKANRRGAVK